MKRIFLIVSCLITNPALAQEFNSHEGNVTKSIASADCAVFLAIFSDRVADTDILKGLFTGYIIGRTEGRPTPDHRPVRMVAEMCELDFTLDFTDVVDAIIE